MTTPILPTIKTCPWCAGLIAYRSCQQPDSELVALLALAAHQQYCLERPADVVV